MRQLNPKELNLYDSMTGKVIGISSETAGMDTTENITAESSLALGMTGAKTPAPRV